MRAINYFCEENELDVFLLNTKLYESSVHSIFIRLFFTVQLNILETVQYFLAFFLFLYIRTCKVNKNIKFVKSVS